MNTAWNTCNQYLVLKRVLAEEQRTWCDHINCLCECEILPGNVQVSGILRLRQRYTLYTENQRTSHCSPLSFGSLKDRAASETVNTKGHFFYCYTKETYKTASMQSMQSSNQPQNRLSSHLIASIRLCLTSTLYTLFCLDTKAAVLRALGSLS